MFLDLTPGHGNLLGRSYWEMNSLWLGEYWTLNTGVSPREERESSLSRILQADPPRKYYLSKTACLGILRRARERGKALPAQLKAALEIQAGLSPPDRPVGDGAYHINQRNEGIDLGHVSGALMATANMQMQTFVTGTPTAFAANQRDEVRDLHDVAAALGAQPGMKQQTFVADCLNPWDTQQKRVFLPEGVAPTLAGADGGGGRNPGGLMLVAGFSAGAGPGAGTIGYGEEVAPTLKGSASGNMMPSILCLNDQGGGVMACTEEMTGTLRAQEHGHQPLVLASQQGGADLGVGICPTITAAAGMSGNNQPVLFENHGIDARYTGPLPVAPTMSARYGTGGNNIPLISKEASALFTRQRVDKFLPNKVAGTESARQRKDATDLVLEPTLLIRRLTPLECERLQGFPDGWTALPGAADSSRYKALGNSVAIPCVDFVLQGIAAVLRLERGA